MTGLLGINSLARLVRNGAEMNVENTIHNPLSRATALGEGITATADEIERTRCISSKLLANLHDARLCRLLLPLTTSYTMPILKSGYVRLQEHAHMAHRQRDPFLVFLPRINTDLGIRRQ